MTRESSVLLGALLAAVFTAPALADVTRPDGTTIDCYCTDKTGSRVELGQTICMQVDGRMFMAQCQMSLNVPMWRQVEDGCAVSDKSFSVPGDPDAGAYDAS